MVGKVKRNWGVMLPCTVLLLGAVGCGDLTATQDTDDASEGGAGEDVTAGSSGPGSPPATNATGPGLDTDADDDTWDGDGTNGTDEGLPDDCNLECGGGGYCDDLGDGPTCICEEGFASTGLDCIPCEAIAGGDLPADVPAIDARFVFTIGGQPPPASPVEVGNLFLHNIRTGDVVELGRTTAEQASRLLIPGVYDAFYRLREGGTDVPVNTHAKIGTVEVIQPGQVFELDVPVATVAGSFTINRATLNDAAVNYGRVWLVDPATGDRALLGETRDETFVATVIPGEYEIHYEARESQGSAPANRDAYLGELTVNGASEVVQDFTIDVPSTTLSGALQIDGVDVPNGTESGLIELRDVRSGDRFPLGRTSDVSYAAAVVPGEYEVFYSSSSSEAGDVAPVNTNHLLQTVVVQPGSMELDVNVPTAPYEGSITVGDAVPPTSNSDDGVLLLRGSGSDVAYLGNTNLGAFARRVIPGEYSIYYAQETASGVMPSNTNAILEGPITVLPEGALNAEIDIKTVVVSGALTIAGGAAPDSPYDDGRLYLRNAATGDSVLLGNTRLGTYSARIVPGTYDVVYQAEFSDGIMPLNRAAVLEPELSFDETATFDINIDVTRVEGAITVAGSAPNASEGIGELYLRDVAADDLVYLGHTGAPSFEAPVLSGRYLVEYHGVASEGGTLGVSLPANKQSVFACFDIISD